MSEIYKTQRGGEPPSQRDRRDAVGEPLNQTLRSLTNRLNASTVGVALFNKSLRCEALNGVFARMNGASLKSNIGKTIRELFGIDALKLESLFLHLWATGGSISNFVWRARFPANAEPTLWHVNVCSVKDVSGEIRLLATTFSEVTKRSSVERQLDRLTDRFQADILDESSVFGEEFAELSARAIQLVKRSVDLLKSSTSLRCYVSETRIETGLEGMDLFLEGTRALELLPYSDVPGSGVEISADPELPAESELPSGGPSPRERQILHLLADGKSNKEIGLVLDISARTVECYRARIMIKLDLHSTAALVRYAIRNNIVDA